MVSKQIVLKSTTVLIALVLLFILIERQTLPPTTEAMHKQAARFSDQTGKPNPPESFQQDGCSLFVDSLPGHDFRNACLQHDIHYWAGGPIAERKLADIALREDISHTGLFGPILAPIVYGGVRLFGNSPITKAVDAHWGYDWN